MTRSAVLALLAASFSLAAPVPQEDDAARLRRIYGEKVDPGKQCKFELTGDKLRVSIPDTSHALPPVAAKSPAPRVMREVEGDFTAVVRVSFPIRQRAAKDEGPTVRSGGLIAWVGEGEHVRVTRCDSNMGGPKEMFWQTKIGSRQGETGITTPRKQGEAAYLRMRREGKKVLGAFSRDGKEWTELSATEVEWGERVKVGVVAENASPLPFEVVFDQYTLTVPKK